MKNIPVGEEPEHRLQLLLDRIESTYGGGVRLDILQSTQVIATPPGRPRNTRRVSVTSQSTPRITFSLYSKAGRRRQERNSGFSTRRQRLSSYVLGDVAILARFAVNESEPIDASVLQAIIGWVVEASCKDDSLAICAHTAIASPGPVLHRLRRLVGGVASIAWYRDQGANPGVLRMIESSGIDLRANDIPVGHGFVGTADPFVGPQLINLKDLSEVAHPRLVQKQGWNHLLLFPMVVGSDHIGFSSVYFRELSQPADDFRQDGRGRMQQLNALSSQLCVQILATIAADFRARRVLETRDFLLADRASKFTVGLTVLGLVHDLKSRAERLATVASIISEALPEEESKQKNMSEMLANAGLLPADDKGFLASLADFDENASYISRLISSINQINEPAYKKSGTLNLRSSVASVEPMLLALRSRAGGSGAVDIDIESDIWLQLTEHGLARILLNLVSNSLSWGATKVTLQGRHKGEGYATLKVTDNGDGMSDEQLERCAEPFYTTRDGGTGLGLFVVSHIVSGFGGSVAVKSWWGKSTTVEITFKEARAK